MKKWMFLETSILEAFWEDFGRVLGGQNPPFSHFFRCFFDVNFEARFEGRKKRPKTRKKNRFPHFWERIPVVPKLLGIDYREGSQNISDSITETWPSRPDPEDVTRGLARPAPPTVGGGSNPPGGITAAHPPLAPWPTCDWALALRVFGVSWRSWLDL